MKLPLTALVITCMAWSANTAALEATATAKDVDEVDPEISVMAQNAIVLASITKINQELMSVLRCNKKNKFYKPTDTTKDADGCVGASISTSTSNKTATLSNFLFDSYPGSKKGKKGYSGSSISRSVSLANLINDGATSISIQGTLSGFIGNCAGIKGTKTMNIANVHTSVAKEEYQCHYDNSPNRSSYVSWSYNASNKTLTMQSRMGQTNSLMDSARLTSVTAKYTVTKTVLKVGDGN